MSNPDLTLSTAPFRLTRHKRTISRHTLDTILETALSSTSSRPSTASTTSSFSTAFSSLEAGSPFRYYLPHISTPTSPFFTRNENYACNLTPSSRGVQADQVGLFYHYMPSESTETSDVYTNGFDTVLSAPTQLPQKPKKEEQKALQELKDFVFKEPRTPVWINSPLSHIGPFDFPYRPSKMQDEGIDVGSYTAGEMLDTRKTMVTVDDGKAKRQRTKLTKAKDRKPETTADVSKKVKKMLRRLHLGRKQSGQS